MASRPRILLFDIDGTLLTADGAGRRAMTLALHEVTGVADAVAHIDFRGMTDALLVEQALAGAAVAQGKVEPQAVFNAYLRFLELELAQSASSRALPGAAELLKRLGPSSQDQAIGLGTGNLEPAAYLKLARVGLAGHFDFGGFGSDHRIRSEIIRIAAERGCGRLGLDRASCDVIVIGDTFHDVDAALAIGALCVCVSTSGHAIDALKARGAKYAYETLEDPHVLKVLTGAA